jgi:hypothetical protein
MNLLDLESEKIKTVTVQGHDFKIRYMTPIDRIKITQRRMRLQDGNPVTSLTDSDYIFFENIAIVDVCVEEYPKNFKAHETCAKWEDIDLINKLAHEIRTHTTDLEQKLKKNKPTE